MRRGSTSVSHWALTPDEADPGSWRLPLTDSKGKWDKRRISAALGALSPDAEPTIPVRLARVARQRIRDAWHGLHGPNVELPAVLRKAGDLFAPPPLDRYGNPYGVMVAFAPDASTAERLALDEASVPDTVTPMPVDELHCTLVYFGNDGWDGESFAELVASVRQFATGGTANVDDGPRFPRRPLTGEITGWGTFTAGLPDAPAPGVALVDMPGLGDFRSDLSTFLNQLGFPVFENHGFLPHITLAYGPREDLVAQSIAPFPVVMDELIVSMAGQVVRVPLDGDRMNDRVVSAVLAQPVLRAAAGAPDRYTLSPLYAPDLLDSHAEWSGPTVLERAQWDYVDRGEFALNFQHRGGLVAGRCVGIITWPFELVAQLATGDGKESTVTLPPGTVYQGVIWEEWAWPLVVSGEINALSLEGLAVRREGAPDGQA